MLLRNAGSGFWAVVLSAVLLACGDDEDGTKPTHLTTGLPATQKLSEVGAGDAQMVCETLSEGIEMVVTESERKRLDCVSAALSESATLTATNDASMVSIDVAACEDLVARCQRGESIGDDTAVDLGDGLMSEAECNDVSVSAALAMCDATVGEYEACLNATLDATVAFLQLFNCQTFTDPVAGQKMLANYPNPMSSDACKPITTQCAGLFAELSGN